MKTLSHIVTITGDSGKSVEIIVRNGITWIPRECIPPVIFFACAKTYIKVNGLGEYMKLSEVIEAMPERKEDYGKLQAKIDKAIQELEKKEDAMIEKFPHD